MDFSKAVAEYKKLLAMKAAMELELPSFEKAVQNFKKSASKDLLGTIHKLRRQPELEGGSAKSAFLPTMPNLFAYEGGEGGSKIRKIMPT